MNQTPGRNTGSTSKAFLPNFLKEGKIPTPKEIVEYLDERVIGQAEAKKRLAVAISNHYKRVLSNIFDIGNDGPFEDVTIDKSNILMLGDTGTGKTFLIQNIAKMLGVPCHIHDCTKLTAAGYVGEDVENILVGLLQECNYDLEKAKYGIVCLDEVDKIAKKGDNMSITRDVSGECVQQSLLKIIEGNEVGVMPQGGRKHPEQPLLPVDTTNILFIGMGAFVGLDKIIEERLNQRNKKKVSTIGFNIGKELEKTFENETMPQLNVLDDALPCDLNKFGMIPEFVGRFPIITHTNPLTEENLAQIIKTPKNSILKQYQKLAYIDGKTLEFTDEAVESIAHAAIVNETGARGLRAILESVLNDFMFDFSASRKKKIVITKTYCDSILKRILYYNKDEYRA